MMFARNKEKKSFIDLISGVNLFSAFVVKKKKNSALKMNIL